MGRLVDADKLKNIFLKSRSKVFDYRIVIQEIAYAPTVEAIPKADYENRLKADLVAMLTEIQLKIEETEIGNADKYSILILQGVDLGKKLSKTLIQQKINALKGEQNT